MLNRRAMHPHTVPVFFHSFFMQYSFLKKALTAPFLVGVLLGGVATTFGATMLGSARFSDVPLGSYFDAPVGRLVDQGVIKGFPDGTFRPDQFVTRADVAVMIDRAVNGVDNGSNGSTSTRSSRSSASSQGTATVGAAGAIQFTTTGFNVAKASKKATITVIRTGGKKGEVKVDYVFGGGSTTAVEGTDYAKTSGTVTFPDGETTKTISVTMMRNEESPPRTLEVHLSNATNGAVLGTLSTLVLNLLGNSASSSSSSTAGATTTVPSAGALEFSANAYAVDEAGGSLTITVNRRGGSTGEAKVNYAVVGGTATSGTHYTLTSGTLTFAAGETVKTFSMQVSDNATIDGNKTVNIALNTPTGGAVIGTPSTAVVSIIDSDVGVSSGSGSVQFSTAGYTVLESGGSVTVTVIRQGSYTGTINVNYATSDGTATAGSDYTNTSGTLVFAPGESSKQFFVPIIKDALTENEETINVNLSNVTGGTIGERSSATIRIQ